MGDYSRHHNVDSHLPSKIILVGTSVNILVMIQKQNRYE